MGVLLTKAKAVSCEQIVADLREWEKTARQVLGSSYIIPKIARLPGGEEHYDGRVLGVFNDLGYTVIDWSADTLTGVQHGTPQNKAEYVLASARIGAIMLQHFTEPDSLAVELYTDRLIAKGIPLGLASEALAANQANQYLTQ